MTWPSSVALRKGNGSFCKAKLTSNSRSLCHNRLPTPSVPDMDLLKDLILDAIPVAVVGYCISLSLAKLFATKNNYKINGSQEMLAHVRRV